MPDQNKKSSMSDKELYQRAYEFLLSFEGVHSSMLEEHFVVKEKKPNDLKLIYKRLCESAQNKQMSTKVIGGSINGFDNLGKVLKEFDPHKFSSRYAQGEDEKLLENIIKILNPKGQIRRTSRSIWPLYCKTVIDAAHFLKRFDTAADFYNWTDFFSKDSRAKPALPLMISYEISGIGFPLACDFLKELGFSEYGKPDVHLKYIFKELGLIAKTTSAAKSDYETLKVIDRIAKENNVTSYAVDKMFWLIGSGSFYLSGLNIGRNRNLFVDQLKKNFSSKYSRAINQFA